MVAEQVVGDLSLTVSLQQLAHALALDASVSQHTRDTANQLYRTLCIMDQVDELVAVQLSAREEV